MGPQFCPIRWHVVYVTRFWVVIPIYYFPFPFVAEWDNLVFCNCHLCVLAREPTWVINWYVLRLGGHVEKDPYGDIFNSREPEVCKRC